MTWSIAWSAQVTAPVASIEAGPGWIAIGHGRRLTMLDDAGAHRWSADVLFSPHRMVAAGPYLGVLAAHGFTVHQLADGVALNEGRSATRGFSSLVARPGGGWIASGREGGLHLFSAEGRGRRRIDMDAPRAVRGALDRDHAVVHAKDGLLHIVHLDGGVPPVTLGDTSWTWSSPMGRDGLLLRSVEGVLHRGAPGPSGWDRLDRVDDEVLEPVAACRTSLGWCVLELDGRVREATSGAVLEGSDGGVEPMAFLASDGEATLVGVTRSGLIRCWYGGERERVEREARRALAADGARQDDWALRRRRFEAAVEAEASGDWEVAAEHYDALGRTQDAARVRKQRGEGA